MSSWYKQRKYCKIKKGVKKLCLKSTSEIIKNNAWTSKTPYDIRDEAMCDLLKAFKTCFSVGEKFKMKFKRKKDNTDSIVIHSKHFNASRKKEKKEQLSKSKAKQKEKKNSFYDFIPKMKSSEKVLDLLE